MEGPARLEFQWEEDCEATGQQVRFERETFGPEPGFGEGGLPLHIKASLLNRMHTKLINN